VVGNGADCDLEAAMYKAFIECSAMPHMAIVSFAQEGRAEGDGEGIDNLDDNVFLYSLPENREALDAKFTPDVRVPASLLPDLSRSTVESVTRAILEARGARLALLDMTSPEIADLGFHVFRFYTPDLLPFGLPSYPPAAHPGFASFGGLTHERPHPYA
jgi:hypothetical protein